MKNSARTAFAGVAAAVALLAGVTPVLASQPATTSTEAATAITGTVTAWDRDSDRMTLRNSSGISRVVDASDAAIAQDVSVGQAAKATGEMQAGILKADQVARAV